MQILSRPLRSRRSHEWSTGKTVTFIVTLAATRSVTLAADAAGMSRKSAYALKARDPIFAEAWTAVLARPAPRQCEGDRPTPPTQAISSTDPRHLRRLHEEVVRDRFFARLRALAPASPPLAPHIRGQ